MRSILSLLAICTICFVTACESTDNGSASMGVIGSETTKCGSECSKACCDKDASMGAVGDKAGCSKTCPVTGKATDTSMGVIGDESGCRTKSSCSGKAADTSMGAVSEKSSCSSKSSCTKTASDG